MLTAQLRQSLGGADDLERASRRRKGHEPRGDVVVDAVPHSLEAIDDAEDPSRAAGMEMSRAARDVGKRSTPVPDDGTPRVLSLSPRTHSRGGVSGNRDYPIWAGP